jgi:hypothetical protein
MKTYMRFSSVTHCISVGVKYVLNKSHREKYNAHAYAQFTFIEVVMDLGITKGTP